MKTKQNSYSNKKRGAAMKKQRWRKTKVKTCYLCDKKLNINQIRGINDWSYKNKILYWCEDCVEY